MNRRIEKRIQERNVFLKRHLTEDEIRYNVRNRLEPDDVWIHTTRGHKDSIRRYALSRAYQKLSLEDRAKYMNKSFPLYDEVGNIIPRTNYAKYEPTHDPVH